MKKLISLFVLLACPFIVNAQTAKSRADIYTEIDTQLASGQQMSAATLRSTLKNISASAYNGLTDGTALTAASASSLYQPLSAQLSNLASLTGTNVIYYRNASGSWVAVTVGTGLTFSSGTLSSTAGGGNMSTSVYDTDGNGVVDTSTALATARTINGVSFNGTANITVADSTKEPAIAAGTTSQFWRGDKSWQTLDKSAVGLGNSDNTSDANKPISTATQTALNLKAPIANPTFTGTASFDTLTASTLNFTAWGTGTVPDANIASTIARDSEVTAAVAAVTPTSLSLVIGTNTQAYDADLASWAGVTRASGFDTFSATPSAANFAALVTGETGTGTPVFGTNPTLVSPTYTVAAVAASAIDWAAGDTHTKTLSANTTFTFSNASAGKQIVVAVTNTASNYTVTWPTVSWSGGTAPTQTTGAKTDIYTFIQIGSTIYGSVIQNF